MIKRAVFLWTLLFPWGATAPAQLISIRTVPVSQAHQFDIFPSRTMAMGGVSIAVSDTVLDLFANPATGARLGAPRVFGSPGLYSVSSGAGAGRTLPLGAVMKANSWYGGFSLAVQEVDMSERAGFPPIRPAECPACAAQGIDLGPIEQSHGNTYAFALLGRELPATGLSVGGSVLWSRLSAVDGVDLLYAGSASIKQYGDALDVRLGLLKKWEGDRTLEAVVLHNRFGMTHDVLYLDGFWDPGTRRVIQRPRLERNLDRTSTWGLHFQYERPLSADGWRVGWLATVNRMAHPKIPNYEIMNIPRDPGYSSAFNMGIGFSRMRGATPTFGIDAIYEPIWSYTWADTEGPIETGLGDTIPAGGKTIENRFRFSNALLRVGVAEQVELDGAGSAVGFQFGLAIRTIHYRLAQRDNVLASARDHEERWVEWTPTWGISLRFPELEISYRGRITNGTGRPGVVGGVVVPLRGATLDAAAGGSNIIVAPSGPLTLTEVLVMTHQVSFSLPLR